MTQVDRIYAELQREQAKLISMPLRGPGTLHQSQVVDRLINDYMRAQQEAGADEVPALQH